PWSATATAAIYPVFTRTPALQNRRAVRRRPGDQPSRSGVRCLRDKASERLRIEHEVVTTLGELRRVAGFNQSEIAERWGRGQAQVSKVERAPDSVGIAKLAGYVRGLGGNLPITIEVGRHTYREDLVAS
ncbi:MAG: hypothetical protein ACRD1G_06165, partial [Acidimicrobiales bacterium]